MLTEQLSSVLRAIAGALQIPVMIVLILIMAATVFLLGTLIAEGFTRSRSLAERRTRRIERFRAETCSDSLAPESLALSLFKDEKRRCEGIVKLTDAIAKLGPMFGLLGTLIPLGPGIIALGRGDTYTLSLSLLTAFDTTVAGLISAAAAFVISGVRKRWYAEHLAVLETEMEKLLNEK
ncbi:MAG: MotA/TolQ/ExbB proton channel family protein [Oscillospiraceae bacterium]|jgi:biopolymer transport protein ExbB/TolQ|nr:MotA/TolQ/ExbB proton channel family protein [Oscillospiraceae bacterium]